MFSLRKPETLASNSGKKPSSRSDWTDWWARSGSRPANAASRNLVRATKQLKLGLEKEKDRGLWAGDLLDSPTDRGIYATDAGNYRIVPQLIVAPKTRKDLELVLDRARETGVPITPRGAGTSCAGNAIGPGVIIDYVRYLNRIIDIDPERQQAVVEPGVIQGQLQKAAAVYGLRFGPDPSTSNRCTIGGMMGNNACGPHATAYGRTADNVLGWTAVDGWGRRISATVGREQLMQQIPGLHALIQDNLGLIRPNFGRFHRQVSGYSLEHLLPENGEDLTRFLVGSEGTLATITQATVRLVPLPTAPVLVALGFPDMIAAAAAVPKVLPFKPLAVEGLDARLVEVVRQHRGPGAVPQLPPGAGWLLCEVGQDGLDEAATIELAWALAQASGADREAIMVYPPGEKAAALWRIRADGAGLGGRTPVNPDGSGGAQGWPGWEDAAVPPESLADYLTDFQELMRQFQVDGLLYGHFGDGCVHVRLDLPLGSAAGVGKSRDFLFQAADLVARYGGSVSGEHGDGRARSELLSRMYPTAALELFRQVKGLFDPQNLLNPGVICTPPEWPAGPDRITDHLRRPQAQSVLAEKKGFAFSADHGNLTDAFHRCTGVGKCRADNSAAGGFMCPSFQAIPQEANATRARARILQEATNGSLIRDLSDPEIWQVLDLCLACKACSADCPTGVDLARWRSEALWRRYRRQLRPTSHYLLGWLPRWLRLSARVPGSAQLANRMLALPPIRRLAFALAGISQHREMPKLETKSLLYWAQKQAIALAQDSNTQQKAKLYWSKEKATCLLDGGARPEKTLVLWADSFSHGLDARGAKAAINLLSKAGWKVLLAPPDSCCGLTWITTGQLPGAKRQLRHFLARMAPLAANGIPIVGIEPSCTAVIRDDLAELLPNDHRVAMVKEMTFTLAEFIDQFCPDLELPDLSGMQIVAQPHCHHYSVMGWEKDQALLRKTGAELVQLSGCCGLAGNFGMEKNHWEMSKAVAENSLLPALAEYPEAIYLADGFSCRTQAQQLARRHGVHLAELLWRGRKIGEKIK